MKLAQPFGEKKSLSEAHNVRLFWGNNEGQSFS